MNHKTSTALASLLALATLGGCASPQKLSAPEQSSEVLEVKKQITQQYDENKIVEKAIEAEQKQIEPQKQSRFNLNVKDGKAKAVLQYVADKMGLNLVTREGVDQARWTVKAKNVTAKQAIALLEDQYGIQVRYSDGYMTVGLPEKVSKVISLNYLAISRQDTNSLGVSKGASSTAGSGGFTGNTGLPTATASVGGVGGGGSSSSDAGNLKSTIKHDFWEELKTNLKDITDADTKVVINVSSGTLYVEGNPNRVKEIESYVKKLEASLSRQVVIQAKIIEVTLSEDHQEGVNWSAFARNGNTGFGFLPNGGNINPGSVSSGIYAGTGANGGSAQLKFSPGNLAVNGLALGSAAGFAFAGTNFAAMINFLESQGRVSVVTSPQISVINNQPAVIKSGDETPFVIGVSSTTTALSANTTSTSPQLSTQNYYAGVFMNVLAQISDEDKVTLMVSPSIYDVKEKTISASLGSAGNVNYIGAINTTKSMDTVIKLASGNIAVIGGLINTTEISNQTGLPGLAETPGVGAAFRGTDRKMVRKQLFILLQPTVIKQDSDWIVTMNPMSK